MYDLIPKAFTADEYLDVALKRGRVAASRVTKIANAVTKVKAKERDRMRAIKDSLCKSFQQIHDAYPSFDHMGEFTLRVFSMDMEPGRVKQALGGVNASVGKIQSITSDQIMKVGKARDGAGAKKAVNGCLGRIQSVLKLVDKHLSTLNEARFVFRGLPTVDESLFTVAIAGFPNVGKSTLLRKLTTAKPEVKPYAFTTKGLNVGYFSHKYNKIQCIDTPGTLNRKKMNAIEMKADIALKYLASCVIYVFDPTESYPMKDQQALYEHILELDLPTIVYVSKTDLVETELEGLTDAKDVKEALLKSFAEWS